MPRNATVPSGQEKGWCQQVVDQITQSSMMRRDGTNEEQAAAILFVASDETLYTTGTVLPVAGGDQG